MEKSDSRTEEIDTARDSAPASSREEEFWQEQELIRYDNNDPAKRRFWAEIEHQDALERERKEREERIRRQRQQIANRKNKAVLAKKRRDRKELIRNALKIINPRRRDGVNVAVK